MSYQMKRLRLKLAILLFSTCCAVACTNSGDPNDSRNGTSKDTTALPDTSKRNADTSILTVAMIRELPNSDTLEVLFNESARVFLLTRGQSNFTAMGSQLEKVEVGHQPVKVVFDEKTGLIQKIDSVTKRETDSVKSMLGDTLRSGSRLMKVDLKTIDTNQFNRMDHPAMNFEALRACNTAASDLSKANEIFQYCMNQVCTRPSTTETPCITFQYVKDGCFARAHKMRQIIESRYGPCVAKVFSFATAGNDKLAVKANKWGGCCVSWWYHVAPAIKVKLRVGTTTTEKIYVIDPGMFDGPVTVSTWLYAQKNTSCYSLANFTSYTIQPGDAYTPNGTPGSFNTDPNYLSTNATLKAYRNLRTCN